MVAMRAARLPTSRPDAGSGRRLFRHWRVFCPGTWNGETFTARDLREMAANFNRFLRPVNSEHPYYVPFVSMNHEDGTLGLADGEVLACGVDPDGWLWVDFATAPEVAAALDTGRLRRASIEWWNTRLPAHRKANFPLTPDGRQVGLVLRALTLCGAMAESVKGQSPPPKSEPLVENRLAPWTTRFGHLLQRFDDSAPPLRAFVEIPTVDELVQKILAMSPGLTPEQAEQIAFAAGDWFKSQSGDPAADPNAPSTEPDADNMPPTGEPSASVAPTAAPPADGQMGDGCDPKSMIQKFADLAAKVESQTAEIATLKGQLVQAAATKKADADAASDSMIQRFADAVRTSKKATPAEADRLLAGLKMLAPELRETQVGVLRKQYELDAPAPIPADRQFADESTRPTGPTPGFLDLMKLTPLGRTVLKQSPVRN